MGETLTPNPNECNLATLMSGTRRGRSPHLYHINWGGCQLPNPNECISTLTSGTRGETLTPNPDECYSRLTSAVKGGILLPLTSICIPSESSMILRQDQTDMM